MSVSINQIKVGMGLSIDGNIYVVTEHAHVKPGKGGAFAKVKLKNIKTQQVLERTIKPADKVDDVALQEKNMQYLYHSSDGYHFMDMTTYEETMLQEEALGDGVKFLSDNLEVTGTSYNDKVLKINLPIFIEAEVTHTEPGFRGDTSKAGNKPATIDTGATIQVPLFVDIGNKIKVDTRTGSYVERVK